MFLRGQTRPCPRWPAELDVSVEVAEIQENWIEPGKMLSWHNISDGFSMISPKFEGISEDQGLTLWFYTFPNLKLFKEWAIGAPEHVAIHTKLLEALKAAAQAREGADQVQPISVLPSYSFHAAHAPHDQIPATRAESRELYRQIADTDWVGVPPGTIKLRMACRSPVKPNKPLGRSQQ